MLDVIAVIAKRKRLIISITATVAIITVIVLFMSKVLPSDSRFNLLPNKFKPTVKILLQDTSATSSLSSMLSQSGLGSLSGLIGLSGASKPSNADLAQALLKSNTVKDGVVERFGFIERYKITKMQKTVARQIIDKSLKSQYNAKSGILEISYEGTDPLFATEVINDITDRLQMVFKSLTLDKVSTKKSYLESAIASAEKESGSKSKQLADFQNKYGIYDLTSQAEVNITAVAEMQAQLRLKQIDLAIQKKYYPESDTRVIRLKDEIDQMQKQIEQLNAGDGTSRSGSVPLSRMTELGTQYLTLQNEVKVQAAILTTLKQQYEMARLEELDTSMTFQVIEKAEVPETRSAPGRSKIAAIATIIACLLSIVVAFVIEYFERARRDPVESKKLAMITSSLSFRKKQSRD